MPAAGLSIHQLTSREVTVYKRCPACSGCFAVLTTSFEPDWRRESITAGVCRLSASHRFVEMRRLSGLVSAVAALTVLPIQTGAVADLGRGSLQACRQCSHPYRYRGSVLSLQSSSAVHRLAGRRSACEHSVRVVHTGSDWSVLLRHAVSCRSTALVGWHP